MALLDRDMRYVRMNDCLAALHEAPAQTLLGRTLWEVLPPIARDDLIRDFQKVVDGVLSLVERTVTAPPRVPGDRQRTFVITWYPVSVAGRLIGVGSLVQEVTEQRVADESRRHLLGVVGHDLRSPLMAITASAELLQAGQLDDRAARLVGRILRASGRIDGIIRALVDYTLVQGGPGVSLQSRRLDLVGAGPIGRPRSARRPTRAARSASPRRSRSTGSGTADRIGQAIANLVNNALQYSPDGTPVEVACWAEAAEALVEITNAGAPIPADLVPHLFEPFQRGTDERTQRRKGLGLGLYIAVQIAVAHGGKIACGRTRPAAPPSRCACRARSAVRVAERLERPHGGEPAQERQRDLPAVPAAPVEVGEDVGEREVQEGAGAGGERVGGERAPCAPGRAAARRGRRRPGPSARRSRS